MRGLGAAAAAEDYPARLFGHGVPEPGSSTSLYHPKFNRKNNRNVLVLCRAYGWLWLWGEVDLWWPSKDGAKL